MALIVGTDSYISETDAASYLAANGLPALTTPEALLRRATRALDVTYGARFIGAKRTSTQALLWPRQPDSRTVSNVDGLLFTDSDGNYRDFGGIPREVAEATVEMASVMDRGTDVYAQPEPMVIKQSFEVDVIKEQVEYARSYSTAPLYKITLLLRPLLVAPGSFQLVR